MKLIYYPSTCVSREETCSIFKHSHTEKSAWSLHVNRESTEMQNDCRCVSHLSDCQTGNALIVELK